MNKLIDIVDVSKSFKVNRKIIPVIENAFMEVNEGDFVVILGPSGSGKTTLLHMLAGIDKPTSGSIIVAGQDIATFSINELSEWRLNNIGIIFQSYNLMPFMSSLDNVALPLIFAGIKKKQRLAKANTLLRTVGLKEKIKQDTNLLSGGEQQRVAIARALINDPKILIADEPTGDLDLANATEVMEIIYSLYKEHKTTIIMSTHNPNYAKYADKVICIKKGQVSTQKGFYAKQ
jgi:putative ABC transport system ATP-binding protein